MELPEDWLGQRFLGDAEHLQRVNPQLYRLEYLGIPMGSGEEVFPNLVLQSFGSVDGAKIPRLPAVARDDRVLGRLEVARDDKAVGGLGKASGVDWGWWPDTWAFNRVAYDGENRILYILAEKHCYRTGNRETGLLVKSAIPLGETVIADSAEPKSIGDYRQLGL